MTNTNKSGSAPASFNVVLVDDEPSARNVLRLLIEQYCPTLQIVGEAGSVREGFKVIREQRPALLLLDVEMQDGSGFDLLDKFKQPNFKVIFTTAHDKFAIRAFQYYAIGYLLKPVEPEQLVAVVDHLITQPNANGILEFITAIRQGPSHKIFDRIALPDSEGITMMNIKDILRLESDSGYTTFHTIDGEKLLITRSIGEFEDVLSADIFFRTHVSHIINLDYVKKYIREDGGCIVMTNGSQIPIARRRKDDFLEALRSRSAF